MSDPTAGTEPYRRPRLHIVCGNLVLNNYCTDPHTCLRRVRDEELTDDFDIYEVWAALDEREKANKWWRLR